MYVFVRIQNSCSFSQYHLFFSFTYKFYRPDIDVYEFRCPPSPQLASTFPQTFKSPLPYFTFPISVISLHPNTLCPPHNVNVVTALPTSHVLVASTLVHDVLGGRVFFISHVNFVVAIPIRPAQGAAMQPQGQAERAETGVVGQVMLLVEEKEELVVVDERRGRGVMVV